MLRSISHITLLVLILLSATELTINLHYCQDHLYDFALNAPAHNCCETGEHENHCHHSSDMDMSNHCDDETIKVGSTDEFFISSYSFDFSNVHTIDLFLTNEILLENQSTANDAKTIVLNYKKPPTHQEVVLSQIQSFLI